MNPLVLMMLAQGAKGGLQGLMQQGQTTDLGYGFKSYHGYDTGKRLQNALQGMVGGAVGAGADAVSKNAMADMNLAREQQEWDRRRQAGLEDMAAGRGYQSIADMIGGMSQDRAEASADRAVTQRLRQVEAEGRQMERLQRIRSGNDAEDAQLRGQLQQWNDRQESRDIRNPIVPDKGGASAKATADLLQKLTGAAEAAKKYDPEADPVIQREAAKNGLTVAEYMKKQRASRDKDSFFRGMNLQ